MQYTSREYTMVIADDCAMKINKKWKMVSVGRFLALLLLLSGFLATVWSGLVLKSIPTDGPDGALASYSLFYFFPIVCVIWSFLLFEGWACVRTGLPNLWPTIILIYVSTTSSGVIFLSMCTTIDNRQSLLSLRHIFAGPLPLLNACMLVVFFGFYAAVLFRQAKQLPFIASFGRFTLFLWLLYFTLTRLWQPIGAINHILRTMP